MTTARDLGVLTGPAVRARPLRTPLAPLGPISSEPALVADDGAVLSHADLHERVQDLAGRLPDAVDGRRLVHVPLRREITAVVAYLAALAAGHVALVTDEDEDRSARILRRYAPDVRMTADDDEPFTVLSATPRHVLHPDLAVLLSTSGSTGSAKLVRLSHRNLRSNATGIAAALGLTATDRAVTSLPLHYSFGLSVLHSHLAVGASVVVRDGSVVDDGFWESVDTHGVTTLAVVPHMVDLLASTGALDSPHPSLRLVVQAGGRLAPDRALRTARTGAEHGWGLALMYGQTEATARICVLDPALVADHPDAVGRPIAGTSVHLDTTVPEASDGAGEVVVRGPGVMLGYAEHPDDLALGAMLTELRTGDVGRLDEHGLLRIVGRRSGFLKIMGLRVDVGAVETALEDAGLTVCVKGDDTGLRVAVEPEPSRSAVETAARTRRLAGECSGVGVAAVSVAVVPLARLANGKVDRNGCDALVRGDAADECATTVVRTAEALGASPTLAVRVATGLGAVLGGDAIDLHRSFVEHGGDSLSHVQASALLEGLVGPLPRGWHHRPLAELVDLGRARQSATPTATSACASAPGTTATPAPDHDATPTRPGMGGALDRVLACVPAVRAPRLRTVETSVLLRAVAVVIICASHADLFRFLGGAHTLLAVAGFNAARFGLSVPTVAGRWRGAARMLVGIAVPTAAVVLVGIVTTGRYGWGNLALANWVVGDVTYGKHNELWFIDTLAASLVVLAATLSLPPVARRWQRDPWRVAIALAVVALVPRFVILGYGEGVLRGIMPTTFWLFAVGAAVAHAESVRRRAVTLTVAVVGGATFFPDDLARTLTVLGGIALLTLVPEIRVPARWVPLLTALAAASLHIYLVQFQVLGLLRQPLLGTVAAIATGYVLWRLTSRPVRRLQDLVPPPTR